MRVDIGGSSLWFDIDGPGLEPDMSEMRRRPTFVLLHGGPGSFDHSYLKPDFSHLTQWAQVVYLDMPGHGRSDWGRADEWSFEGAGDAVHAFCETMDIEQPIVLGHSFGGPVAISYAARHPDHPAGLVLQSTFARFDLDRIVAGFGELAGGEVAHIIRRSYEGDTSVTDDEWDRCWRLFGPWVPGPVEKERMPRNHELNVIGGRLMLEFDLRLSLAEITCPTLVSVGALDPISPVWAAEEIADGLPSNRVWLDVVEGAGHFPWRDQPDQYWGRLGHFIELVAT